MNENSYGLNKFQEMDPKTQDSVIKSDLEKLFLKEEELKELKELSPHQVAALITAASRMAIPLQIDEDYALDELIALYNVDEDTKGLIGMSPQFVKAAIGYAVDFNDMSAAWGAYVADKEAYDKAYEYLIHRIKERNPGIKLK